VHQDYLLRMIQQLSSFVAGLKQLRGNKQWEQLHVQIGEGIGRFAGLNPSLIQAISEEDLIQLLGARGGIDLDRWWAMAELLREEGLALDEQGDPVGADRALSKSLRLYLEVLAEVDEVPHFLNVTDLEDVVERMKDRDLLRSTRLLLVEYLVTTGRLDVAENVALWALDGPDPMALDDAVALYMELLRKADNELTEGGLSREEVEAGLANLTSA
jgi:hypothetical protein